LQTSIKPQFGLALIEHGKFIKGSSVQISELVTLRAIARVTEILWHKEIST
jgi:hypothetical protein